MRVAKPGLQGKKSLVIENEYFFLAFGDFKE
jgi:hypothetical protein